MLTHYLCTSIHIGSFVHVIHVFQVIVRYKELWTEVRMGLYMTERKWRNYVRIFCLSVRLQSVTICQMWHMKCLRVDLVSLVWWTRHQVEPWPVTSLPCLQGNLRFKELLGRYNLVCRARITFYPAVVKVTENYALWVRSDVATLHRTSFISLLD